WDPGRPGYVPLPSASPGVMTAPEHLDERGGVVGWGYTEVGTRALVWDPGTLAVHIVPSDRGASWAYDRNEHGVLVGETISAGGERSAVFWPSATSLPIPLPGVEARAINGAGQSG